MQHGQPRFDALHPLRGPWGLDMMPPVEAS